MEQAAWIFRPIGREEMVDDILTPVYRNLKEFRASGNHQVLDSVSPHKLAVLYILFSMGALVDLTLDPCKCEWWSFKALTRFLVLDNLESENYYNLCRASLSLRSVLDSPEIATVQAVLLLAAYHSMGGRRYMMDASVRFRITSTNESLRSIIVVSHVPWIQGKQCQHSSIHLAHDSWNRR